MGDARRDPRRPGGRKQAQQRAIVEGQAHAALALLAGVLLLLCGWLLPETRPARQENAAFLPVLRRMATDRQIGLAVILAAAFNVSLFSYYSLAPFIFAELRLPVAAFGYSGMALVGWGQSLGASLVVCAALGVIAGIRYLPCFAEKSAGAA
ncbi:hypothetical protein NGI12_03965 [Raoultella terrigena]|uniref:hypothetical protein n=1 Tax=Raoultella terrigena TaxID=577 RepID=UPI002DBC6314|nr:hypothetical protein [Raoultella terrigena]MEB8192638.1 hypothetical protein [Raoultella terrigena]